MKILVVNCGSSSVKYQFIDMDKEFVLAKGIVSRIGMSGAVLTHKPHDRPEVKVTGEILDHIIAIQYIISVLLSPNHGVIKDKKEIDAVGHRVVHGGEQFAESVLIDSKVNRTIRQLIDLAPLHNPHNIRGINACMKALPDAPQVAVFDTAFHQTMPSKAFVYGIPYLLYRRYGIRRYGFHGPSHYYVSMRGAKMLGKDAGELRIITCHLGNGASITAIDKGKSVDTSMGFTPLEGLLMGTRCGDMDPAVILHIMGREELSLHEANTLMNKHSGLVAKIAFDIYCYRLRKYIGAYAAVMNGVDAIVFTGGVGENSPIVRERTLENMQYMGIELSLDKNREAIGKETDISSDNAAVRTLVIPTNEELVIARDTLRLVNREKSTR
jgi:acetate kinase